MLPMSMAVLPTPFETSSAFLGDKLEDTMWQCVGCGQYDAMSCAAMGPFAKLHL